MVQIPRIYDVCRSVMKAVNSFQELLDNILIYIYIIIFIILIIFINYMSLHIFYPLFEVTKDPSVNPKLHLFLKQMSGFDSVDDESKLEVKLKTV